MTQRDEAITMVEEVLSRWLEMGRQAGAEPRVLAAGRKLAQMLKEKLGARPDCLAQPDSVPRSRSLVLSNKS